MARSIAVLVTVAALSGCTTFQAMKSVPLPEGAREVRGIAYYAGPGADDEKHRLDITVPWGEPVHPVVVFIHGGAWKRGDRDTAFDVYRKLGRKMAARGILTVVPSYRLAPEHKYPAFVEDAARAVAWTQNSIGAYGGSTSELYLMGHSAGAHIAALLVTDPRHLKAAGANPAGIAGVIAISGPYDIPMMEPEVPGLTRDVFGENPEVWKEASATTHLGKGRLPRFLVAIGSGDPENLQAQARVFIQELERAGARVTRFDARARNHFSIIVRLGETGDALGDAIGQFVRGQDP